MKALFLSTASEVCVSSIFHLGRRLLLVRGGQVPRLRLDEVLRVRDLLRLRRLEGLEVRHVRHRCSLLSKSHRRL